MKRQNRIRIMLGSLGLGAGFMYFLDPYRGRRRRALVRDQYFSTLTQ